MPNLYDGKTCLLWSDLWESMVPRYSFPELYSFAKNKSVSIFLAKQMENVVDLFHLPLSGHAFDQLVVLLEALENTANSLDSDVWGYMWGSFHFSSVKAYKLLSGTLAVHSAYSWLWKSNVQPKHKVFFWLLLKDRISTRGLLKRKNMEFPSYNCLFL